MSNIKEWAKGIFVFLFINLVLYFYWQNIFSNLLNWVGTDMLSTGDTMSIGILKTLAWISFILIYVAIGPLYMIFTIIQGSNGNTETDPIELFKGLGVWTLSMPLLIVFFGIMWYLIGTLTTATNSIMDAGSISTATQFSWLFVFGGVVLVTIAPFYFIIKGYGVNIGLGGAKNVQTI